MTNTILSLEHIHKSYHEGDNALHILRDIDFTLDTGEITALVGPSGCGKSTLLQIAGLLDRPDSGNITIAGETLSSLSDKKRTLFRQDHLGYVYQFHHLLPEFSAAENVALPHIIAGHSKRQSLSRAKELLASVGLSDRANHAPAALSGGEKQRVAIARALINRPALLLADEPTGNLDPASAETVFQLLLTQVKAHGSSLLMVTHDLSLGQKADKIVTIDEGSLRYKQSSTPDSLV